MGSVTKSGKGWRAQVRVVGFQGQYKSFGRTEKTKAWAWVHKTETELRLQKRGEYPRHTVQELLQSFRENEAPKHKGARWEAVRTRRFERYPVAKKWVTEVTDDDMALWREGRLKQVSGPTVRREMVLWGQVFEYGRERLRWTPKNIMREVKKPPPSKANPKAVPPALIEKMVTELGSAHKSREVAVGYLLGCETAMRPWEMLGLGKDQVHWRDCVAHLEQTKNGDERDVPLSPGAIELLAELNTMNPDSESFFTVTEGSLTALWGEARKRAGYGKGVHFRHSRREGTRRLSKMLPILDLARAIGHRNLNSLMIYYQESAADMARRLVPQTTPSPSPPASADVPPPKTDPVPESPPDKLPEPPPS